MMNPTFFWGKKKISENDCHVYLLEQNVAIFAVSLQHAYIFWSFSVYVALAKLDTREILC